MESEPFSLDGIFNDYLGRRMALITALTTDSDELYHKCNGLENGVCLFGYSDGKWEVKPPENGLPPCIPDPTSGINFVSDQVSKKEWLSIIATQSDAWLIAISFYFATRAGFGQTERKKLFDQINPLPSLREVLEGKNVGQHEQPASIGQHEQPAYIGQHEQPASTVPPKKRRLHIEMMTRGEVSAPPTDVVAEIDNDGKKEEDEEKMMTRGEVSAPPTDVVAEIDNDGKKEEDEEKMMTRGEVSAPPTDVVAEIDNDGKKEEDEEKPGQSESISMTRRVADAERAGSHEESDEDDEERADSHEESDEVDEERADSHEESDEVDEESADSHEEGDEEGQVCGVCGLKESPNGDRFDEWICCDSCEKWYHFNCVNVTPLIAELTEKYSCPACSQKRRRRIFRKD